MLRWFETNGKESDVVISSRVRLARNVKKYNFSLKLTENDAVKMIDELSEAINSLDIVKDYSSYNFKTLDEYQKQAMKERHVISNFLLGQKQAAGFVSKDEDISIMLNEEDHIRIQAYAPGMDMEKAFELADKKAFEKNIASLKAKITQDFASVAENDPSSITEEVVMAYVAEMALNNKYKEALDSVPSSFKRSSRRTFRTTPYFGNLVDMNRTLAMQLNNDKTIIAQALTSDSLDIFTNWDIVHYILIMKGTENIHRLLSIPSSMQTFEPTLAQAAGILNLYSIFTKSDKSCADLLESVLDKCLEVIENEVKAQEIATLQTGAALVSYGSVAGRGDISATGRFILNTALFDLQAYDLRVLCEIYQMLVKDNIFYPRVIILDGETDPTSPVWVFTAANEVKANFINDTIELSYKFPMLESHYSFVVGVKSFKSIEIYGMNYRTDPRFESYNSSGYSYSADTKTLLLKTRHKAAEEFIKVTLK